jgi:hypothetical protein
MSMRESSGYCEGLKTALLVSTVGAIFAGAPIVVMFPIALVDVLLMILMSSALVTPVFAWAIRRESVGPVRRRALWIVVTAGIVKLIVFVVIDQAGAMPHMFPVVVLLWVFTIVLSRRQKTAGLEDSEIGRKGPWCEAVSVSMFAAVLVLFVEVAMVKQDPFAAWGPKPKVLWPAALHAAIYGVILLPTIGWTLLRLSNHRPVWIIMVATAATAVALSFQNDVYLMWAGALVCWVIGLLLLRLSVKRDS